MRFICLAAVYNHTQSWIETLVQSMIDQDHDDDINIVIIDDRVNGFPAQSFQRLSPWGRKRTVYVVPMISRAENLLAKYNYGLAYADNHGLTSDAVCVIDDDDIYLPDHISQHAKVLETHQWSYPEKVFSTFGNRFNIELSGGRFWASSAYRRTALRDISDYTRSKYDVLFPAFDQLFLHHMRLAHGEGGHQASPTYIYMWDMSQDDHSSGHIVGGVWKYGEIPESPATGPLVPRYSHTARTVFEMAKPFRAMTQPQVKND